MKLESFKSDAKSNWAFRSSNLKTLIRNIDSFYRDELGLIPDVNIIDAALIAKYDDTTTELVENEIAKLIELILGCAVQCDEKSTYIHPIMEMDSIYQASMMHMIENIMHRFPPASPSSPLKERMNSPSPMKASSSSEIYQLTRRIEELEYKSETLEKDNERLVREKQEYEQKEESYEMERRQTIGKRDQVEKTQRLVDAQLQDLEGRLTEKEHELGRTQEGYKDKIEQLQTDLRRQADELDISRSKIIQLGKMESTLAKYKAKLEEASTLRQQMKELEDQNSEYLDKILDLESSVKTIPMLKNTIEKYKDQVVDLETANVEAVANAGVKEQKIARLQEELEAANNGREFLEEQLEGVQNELDSLKLDQTQFNSDMPSSPLSLGESTGKLREKIARLERENRSLREGNGDQDDMLRTNVLENQLDDAMRVKRKLETTNLELKQELQTVKVELTEAKTHLVNAADSSTAGQDTAQLEATIQEMTTQLNTYREKQVGADSEVSRSSRAAIDELTKRLKAKESQINQLASDKEKLENYTKKTLHAVQAKYMVAVNAHKNQLQERNEKIELLELRNKEMRTVQKREEALMMSAFYEVCIEYVF